MIPSREEGYHVLPMDHPSQQPRKYQHRLQSWHKSSRYADSPFQHQNQLHRQQASIMRNFPDIEVKSEEDFSNHYGVSRSSHWTMDDVNGFTPVAGFEPNHDPFRRYFDPRISTQPTTSLPPFYENYFSLDGGQPHCQRQTPNEGTGATFLPLTNTYDQYQMEMVNWNFSAGCTQQRSLGTVLVPMQCEPGLTHPENTDIDGGSGNTTLSGIYRQNLVPFIPYDDHSNVFVATASSSSSSSATSSVTSSMTSSSLCLRTDLVKTETRKIRLASSTSRGKTIHMNIYNSILNRCT